MRGMSWGVGMLMLAVCMAGWGLSPSAANENGSGAVDPAQGTAADDSNPASTAEPNEPDLGVTIRCDTHSLKAGDKIPITFVIENRGDNEYKYTDRNYDRSGRIREYELHAVDEDLTPVPDPRGKGVFGIGGGLCFPTQLAPGESFTKTIALNRWALVTKPGTYQVTGIYLADWGSSKVFTSPPIAVEILPRSDAEMAAHVAGLSEQLALSQDDEVRRDLAEKIVYTCDTRAVPALIEMFYVSGNASWWAGAGFHYYIPAGQEVTDALIAAATARGLGNGMLHAIERVGTPEQLKSLISISLAPEHPAAWAEGAGGAINHPDDAFMPRLIEIAMNRNSGSQTRDLDALAARWSAISALAFNRTDESVAALKKLLDEPDDPSRISGEMTIRQRTEQAIRSAYGHAAYGGSTRGRPLRKDDFGPEFQQKRDTSTMQNVNLGPPTGGQTQ